MESSTKHSSTTHPHRYSLMQNTAYYHISKEKLQSNIICMKQPSAILSLTKNQNVIFQNLNYTLIIETPHLTRASATLCPQRKLSPNKKQLTIQTVKARKTVVWYQTANCHSPKPRLRERDELPVCDLASITQQLIHSVCLL